MLKTSWIVLLAHPHAGLSWEADRMCWKCLHEAKLLSGILYLVVQVADLYLFEPNPFPGLNELNAVSPSFCCLVLCPATVLSPVEQDPATTFPHLHLHCEENFTLSLLLQDL